MTTERITTYTAIGSRLSKEAENYDSVLRSVSLAVGGDEQARKILERCEKEGKHLIFYYPPSNIGTSDWERLGEIDDGELYLG